MQPSGRPRGATPIATIALGANGPTGQRANGPTGQRAAGQASNVERREIPVAAVWPRRARAVSNRYGHFSNGTESVCSNHDGPASKSGTSRSKGRAR